MSEAPVAETVIELRNVGKSFHGEHGSVEAIDEVSFRAVRGEFVTLIGPSGCGKSTVFNLLAGLLEPDAGEVIRLGDARTGASSTDKEPAIGYMPQRDLLFPWRSVIANAALPLEVAGVPPREARARATEMSEVFGLAGFEEKYPAALSGGMRQRAALLRTVMAGGELLLLDEPFGALDAITRRGLQDWLLELHSRLGRTVLFVTHDVDEAVYLADRVIVFTPRPARVAAEHTIDLPRPRNQGMTARPRFGEHVAELLGDLGLGRGR